MTDTESRQKWISTLDRRKGFDFSGVSDDQSLLDQNYATKMRISNIDDSSIDLNYSVGGTNVNSNNNSSSNAATVPVGSINLWNGYELLNKQIVTESATNNNNTSTHNSTHGTSYTNPEDTGSNHGASVGSTVTLGLPTQCPPVYTESTAYLAKMDNLFRFEFSRTQTMNYIHQKLECGEFLDLLKEMKVKPEQLIGSDYCLDANLNVVLANSTSSGGSGSTGLDPDVVAANTAGMLL